MVQIISRHIPILKERNPILTVRIAESLVGKAKKQLILTKISLFLFDFSKGWACEDLSAPSSTHVGQCNWLSMVQNINPFRVQRGIMFLSN